MADEMNVPAAPAGPQPEAAAPVPKRGFLSTTLGKVLLAVVALSVLGALVFAAVLVFLGGQLFRVAKDQVGEAVSQGAVIATATATADADEVAAENRETVPVADFFTFRNPFVPTVRPSVEASPTDGTTDGSTDGSDDGSSDGTATIDPGSVPANTLALVSIDTVDSELQGTFIWNGTVYEAGEGETLGDTPWKVLRLTETSAVMLYGDNEVTLSVGQGITK